MKMEKKPSDNLHQNLVVIDYRETKEEKTKREQERINKILKEYYEEQINREIKR